MAKILIIDDNVPITRILSKMANQLGHESTCVHSLSEGLESCYQQNSDLVLLDLTLPDGDGLSIVHDLLRSPSKPEIIIITGTGDIKGAELSFKYGVWDFLPKPFNKDEVKLVIVRALQYRDEKSAAKTLKFLSREDIIGESPALKSCLELVAQAAASDISILVTGETGTGKELIAKAIHKNSARGERDFVVVDCAVLSPTLLESTLFGHEKGSFTDAVSSRQGFVKQADQGTLFLDEVGELPLSIQKTFLRFLQERKFRPVGATRDEESNFRIIAATNKDLRVMVNEGTFRQDLFYRLRATAIHVPPLRDRQADIIPLAIHHLEKANASSASTLKGYSPDFFQGLYAYTWPGNVRELFNAMDHALMASAETPVIYPFHLPVQIRLLQFEGQLTDKQSELSRGKEAMSLPDQLPLFRDFKRNLLQSAEKEYFEVLMRASDRKIKVACKIAGLSESRLHALLKKYDISRSRSVV